MIKCLQGANVPEWMTKGKIMMIKKDPLKGTVPKKTSDHHGPTYDVENINSTNKGGDLLLANKLRIVPWGTERYHNGSSGLGDLLYLDQHIFTERKTRRKYLF